MNEKHTAKSIAATLKNYKEIVLALIFFVGIGVAALTYYAPLERVKRLECALGSQRLLAIQRDQEAINSREIISSQNQERMLMDLIVLLSFEDEDSNEIKRFKKSIKEGLIPKVEKTRNEVTALMLKGVELKKDVVSLETKLTRKECPNED